MNKKDGNEHLMFGLLSEGKSSVTNEQRVLKDLEKQQKQGHSIHPLHVDPTNGDKENEEK
ncbi:hypothetical protein BK704_01645 [[Bacillus thuringiensis] serovar konkukian]|nr:hypothetical protein [Bacillus thuringiensis]MED1305146.1 hypothetical protein [Bacillus pacificus]OUB17521.1 hypothetical protein BK704_01645 [[Bacillus thuringiensis] serovar konkukian]